MVTISLCMIVRNEEQLLRQCLASVADLVDEINIIDTGSVDKTKELAYTYTDRVFDFEWIDDFAAARNFSFTKATKDYILWLDADDILIEEDRMKFKKLKEKLSLGAECITFKYHYAVDEENRPLLVFRRERLVRRDKKLKWVGFVHEYIHGAQGIIDEDIAVTHKREHGVTTRNLNIYRKKLKEGKVFSNRDNYYYGKELYYNGMYEEAINVLETLVEQPIWVEEKLDCVCKLADCYAYKKQEKKARKLLLRSLQWTSPRAEVLYKLGESYEREKSYEEAIFWYKSIKGATLSKETQGFTNIPLWTWRPYLQVCFCYCSIGEYEKGYYYNQKAYVLQPKDSCVLQNKQFFRSIGFEG